MNRNESKAVERISNILDPESFHEIGVYRKNMSTQFDDVIYKDNVVITGYGRVNNKLVCIYSMDSNIKGGTLGLNHGKKIANLIRLAIKKNAR